VADVFLSYAREDKETAHRLAEAMEARGFEVWWDAEIPPGETWDRMIERELSAARCAVVLWSKTSVGKTWVRTEATEAQKRSVLIPALIDAVEQPIAFRLTQTVSLVGWEGQDDHRGFRQLLSAVERLVRNPAIAPEAALREAENEQRPALRRKVESPAEKPVPPPPGAKRRSWPLLVGLGGVAAVAAVGFLVIGQEKQATTANRVVSTAEAVRPTPEPAVKDLQPASRDAGPAVENVPGRYPFTSQRYLTESDLRNMPSNELKIMRNEIFARHGYIFNTDAMKRYFSRQPWYRPESNDVIDRLSPIELANVQTIKAAEKGR